MAPTLRPLEHHSIRLLSDTNVDSVQAGMPAQSRKFPVRKASSCSAGFHFTTIAVSICTAAAAAAGGGGGGGGGGGDIRPDRRVTQPASSREHATGPQHPVLHTLAYRLIRKMVNKEYW
jgi:hypothetical protein